MSNSSQRSSSSSRASKITQEEMNHLILKLKPLLPQINQGQNGTVSSSEVLKEICNYIMRLQSEADALSDRLSQLLGSMDSSSGVDRSLRNLLQQYGL